MKNKRILLAAGIILIMAMSVMAAPTGKKPVLTKSLPELSLTSSEAGRYVAAKEAAVKNIKPGNSSQVLYANEDTREKSEYCLLYLHGFSASPEEGNPSHVNLGKAFGMNTYIPRLADHGLISQDPLLNMTPENLWNSAVEALAVAKALGNKVILMGTSTGGTLALQLAADFPDIIAGLILYSPNVRIANKASVLLARPFGLQLGRMISKGLYRVLPEDPKTDPYWYNKYRVEGVVYLQQLVEKTMKPKVFKQVTQPVFVGYYFKDKEHQDNTVSVSAILWMYDHLGTPAAKKQTVAFPDAGAHVIGCDLTNPNWKKVYDATEMFLIKTVGLTPVKSR